MAQDGFVDLYEILQVPPDCDATVLRRRISQSYLEAQKNLDHRNAAKRLQFQQLYEVVLPQARHLLLDPSRREEYDRYLIAYRSGRPVEAAPQSAGAPQSTSTPSLDIPDMTPPSDVDPVKLAAEREAMWDTWKSGLETPTEPDTYTLPPHASNAPATETSAAPQTSAATATIASSSATHGATVQNVAPRAVATRSWGNAKSAADIQQENANRSAEELEGAREGQRLEIVRVQGQTASVIWGFASATVVFLLVFALSLFLESYFNTNNNYPIGLSRGTFIALSFLLTLVVAGVAGWFGAQEGRRRKASELSALSYQQLLKRTGR